MPNQCAYCENIAVLLHNETGVEVCLDHCSKLCTCKLCDNKEWNELCKNDTDFTRCDFSRCDQFEPISFNKNEIKEVFYGKVRNQIRINTQKSGKEHDDHNIQLELINTIVNKVGQLMAAYLNSDFKSVDKECIYIAAICAELYSRNKNNITD